MKCKVYRKSELVFYSIEADNYSSIIRTKRHSPYVKPSYYVTGVINGQYFAISLNNWFNAKRLFLIMAKG